jgi:hypothetical protein
MISATQLRHFWENPQALNTSKRYAQFRVSKALEMSSLTKRAGLPFFMQIHDHPLHVYKVVMN